MCEAKQIQIFPDRDSVNRYINNGLCILRANNREIAKDFMKEIVTEQQDLFFSQMNSWGTN